MTQAKGTFQPESDVHITFEDQQKINRFARYNAKLEDLKNELKLKQSELKTAEEACDEITLFDETETVPYLIGEVFVYLSIEKALKSLEDGKMKIIEEISTVEKATEELKNVMSELKGHLYGTFGSHINLENE